MVFEHTARVARHTRRHRSAIGVALLALFILGVWLAPALHRAHCDETHAAETLADTLAGGPLSCADPVDAEDTCRESAPASPASRHSENCSLCKLAKTPMLDGMSSLKPIPLHALVTCSVAKPDRLWTEAPHRSHAPRGPPA